MLFVVTFRSLAVAAGLTSSWQSETCFYYTHLSIRLHRTDLSIQRGPLGGHLADNLSTVVQASDTWYEKYWSRIIAYEFQSEPATPLMAR